MLVKSRMKQLGGDAPRFTLTDSITGKPVSLENVKSPVATVIIFMCNHCPYVMHIIKELVVLVKNYQPKSIVFIGINSNDPTDYPEDGQDKMKEYANKFGYTFPYLVDDNQETGRAYGATCTPDFFVYDKDLKLAYRGRMDDTTPDNQKTPTGKDLRTALDAMLAGKKPNANQIPGIGCSIKWRSGKYPW